MTRAWTGNIFLGRNKKVRLNIETYHFFTDHKFSTSHDNTVATIIAYEQLISKLQADINTLTPQTMEVTSATKAFQNHQKLNWTGTKTDLTELIYALHSSGAINNGNVDIKDIALSLQDTFNIELGNYYHSFTEIRTRKINQTKFLDKLKESLGKYIKSLDD
ncbi:RteC domain-containing protein [Gelidibacter japonicus]|uniref:RteC domain-containing protein n=1 Tax=Gelidibacter japonicus TaxID=1962232 RepID=UPI0013D57648|nr:RteC domain-containing protein [Gelidibacter japonicus]